MIRGVKMEDHQEVKKEDIKNEAPMDDNFLREWAEPLDVKDIKSVQEQASDKRTSDLKVEQCVLYSNEEEFSTNANRCSKKPVTKRSNLGRTKISQKLDSLLSNLCKDAPVSDKFTNLCQYSCPKCEKDFAGWTALNRHSEQYHGVKTLSTLDVAAFICKTVCHMCRICSDKVLCDRFFILRHLKKTHQMSLGQYVTKFDSNTQEALSERSYSDNFIGNLCVYRCQKCRKTFSSQALWCHHRRVFSHCRDLKSRDCLIKTTYHKCKLCNKDFLCDQAYLNSHLKSAHGLSTEKYCQTTGCVRNKSREDTLRSLKTSKFIGNLCVFKCPGCNMTFKTSSGLKVHRWKKKHNDGTSEPMTTWVINGFAYKCEICSKLLLCDRKIIKVHMKDSHQILLDCRERYKAFINSFLTNLPVSETHGTLSVPLKNIPVNEISSTIGNLCRFQCILCKYFSQSWYILNRHYRNTHGKSKYVSFDKELVHTARYHACLMCPKAILSDRALLKIHLSSHKMKISKYENIFRRHGGKILPTFKDWLKENHEKATN